jgi:hypothetical protein
VEVEEVGEMEEEEEEVVVSIEEVMNLGSIVMRVGSMVVEGKIGEAFVEFNEELTETFVEDTVVVVVDETTLAVEELTSGPDDEETSNITISVEDFSLEGLSLDKSNISP